MREAGDTTCGNVREAVALAAGQDLPDAEARRVWSHLARCMACRREYSAFLDLRSALKRLDPERQPGCAPEGAEFFGSLQRDIMARVEEAPVSRRRVAAWAAAAAALLLSAALLLTDGRSPGLLERTPIEPAASVRRVAPPLVPLSYPQGLEAQRQLEMLFEPEHEGTTWLVSSPRPRRSAR